MVDKTIEDAQPRVNPFFPYATQDESDTAWGQAGAMQNAELANDLRIINSVHNPSLRMLYRAALTSPMHEVGSLVWTFMRNFILEEQAAEASLEGAAKSSAETANEKARS